MRYVCEKEINAGDASASITSAGFDASSMFSMSVQSVSTVDSTGTLKVQFSNDQVPTVNLATHWIDVTSATVSVTAASTVAIQKFDICAMWIRLVYTKSGGSTGALTATVKTLGY